MATVAVEAEAVRKRLILRMPPQREGLFEFYDLVREYRLMEGLSQCPGVAMAPCRWLESDPGPLGRPFFVVDFVDGAIPPDRPMSYVHEGWVAEASEAERARLWRSTLDSLVALATVDPYRLGLNDWPDAGRTRVSQHLAMWHKHFDWARDDLDGAIPPLVRELRAWLHANLPREERIGLVWGDSRLGNIIYRDFRPAALLDWELAVIGEPEMDLAYFLFIHELYVAEAHYYQRPMASLTGFMSRAESIYYYELKTGRQVKHFRFYYLFNVYRILCVTQRLASLFLRAGGITHEAAEEMRWLRWSWPLIEREIGCPN